MLVTRRAAIVLKVVVNRPPSGREYLGNESGKLEQYIYDFTFATLESIM